MEKRKKYGRRAAIAKRALAVLVTVCAVLGKPMNVMAGRVVFDANVGGVCCKEDDGSLGVDKWEQDELGYWYYFGPDGQLILGGLEQPCPILIGPDGNVYADNRIRSATGQPGQQPVYSLQSTQGDLCYKGLRQMLDSIPLYPDATTGIPEFDALLDNIFAQIITPDMDTHDKLKACHDYLVLNIKDSRYEDTEDMDGAYELILGPDVYPAYVDGSVTMFTGMGVCSLYSAAFSAMAWKIGLPMYMVSGATSKVGGGYTPHAWCQLDGPDGTVYIFDPHIDYLNTLRGKGAPSNVRFGPTQAQVAGKYVDISVLYDYY